LIQWYKASTRRLCRVREDTLRSVSESFEFDALHRLKKHTKGSDIVTVSYDAIGNIKTKSDVGTYNYEKVAGSTVNNTHKLLSITGQTSTSANIDQFQVNWEYDGEQLVRALPTPGSATYSYNNMGSVESTGYRQLTWTHFEKPASVTATISVDGRQTGSIYEYDPDFNRIYKKDAKFNADGTIDFEADSTTSIYVGGGYERIESTDGTTTHRYTIQAGNNVIQIDRADGSSHDTPTYLLTDNLGSTNIVIDKMGNVEQVLGFDPWGMRLNVGDQSAVNSVTDRGYTGHEMDDETGLINMNARVYDPLIGRFMSADPVLPDAGNMQAFNRYSYVINNPLVYVDPTGNMPAAGGCGIAFRNICGPGGGGGSAGSILGAGGGAPGFIGSGGSGRLGLNCSTSGCNIGFTGAQDSNVGFGDTLFQLQLSAKRTGID